MISFTICGRLPRDPEQSKGPVKFSIAVDQGYGDKKRGVFWDCIAFGKTGERVLNGWVKGKPMLATGRVEQDEYQNKEGVTVRKTVLVVESAHFVPSDNTQRGERPQQASAPAYEEGGDIPF